MPASSFFWPVPESEELYVNVLPVLDCQATLQELRIEASNDDPPAVIVTAAKADCAERATAAKATATIFTERESFM
jgi:hypothetical protein